jgi:hypothetical protein
MAFLLASFYEFTLFLKIVLWIAIPLIIVSFVIATILHYRQKKKNALRAEQHPEVSDEVDISLVSRLQKEVVHYRRRIRELQHALSFAKDVPPEALKSLSVPAQPTDDILSFTSTVNARENLTIQPGTDAVLSNPGVSKGETGPSDSVVPTGNDAISDRTPGTISFTDNATDTKPGVNEDLTDDTSNHGTFPLSPACLQDIVEEQKVHVSFLQQQLESRIKAFHELEYQFRDKAASLEKMTLTYEHLRHQLDDQEAASNLVRIEKDALTAQVARLESSLAELQAQHTSALKLLDAQGRDTNGKSHPLETIRTTASKS